MKTKLNYILVILLALIMIRCEKEDDLLEKSNPNSVTTGNYYTTPDHAETAVVAAYSGLQFLGAFNRYWGYTNNVRSDEADFTPKQIGLKEVDGMDDFTVLSTNVSLSAHWTDNYNGTYKSNVALEKIPGIEFSDEKQKDRLMGEAYFLRALFNYNLVRYFGEEIPLYLQVPKDKADFFPKPAEKGAFYESIIADFKMAKQLLPIVDDYRGKSNLMGRASKGAATAYLGKVYLNLKEYQNAADELALVANNQVGSYSLTEKFRDNHDNQNENNEESIFEVQYELTPGGAVWHIMWENAEASEAQIIEQGQTMLDGYEASIWWNMQPSVKIINEFEASDPRYYKTFWCPGGDVFIHEGDSLTYEEYADSRIPAFGFRKWGTDEFTADWESDVNVRLMRLSDVYLMYAEAMAEGATGTAGDTPEKYVNLVRDRARNIPDADKYALEGVLPTVEDLIAAAPEINGVVINNITNAIRHERSVELAGEAKRWDDILRWGVGDDVLISGWKPLLPIYQTDLDANPNLKPNSSN